MTVSCTPSVQPCTGAGPNAGFRLCDVRNFRLSNEPHAKWGGAASAAAASRGRFASVFLPYGRTELRNDGRVEGHHRGHCQVNTGWRESTDGITVSTPPLPTRNHQPCRLDVPSCAAEAVGKMTGPVEVGCEEQTSNHPKRLTLRVSVGSVGEESSRTRQVWIRKTNASEPLLTRRAPTHDIETDGGCYRASTRC